MVTRRTLIKLPALGALAFYLPPAWPAAEVRRRAVIVGIDMYTAPHFTDPLPTESGATASAAASARIKRGMRFHNLDGAVNDAALMYQILVDRFEFKAEDIVFLQDERATRDQILKAFKAHLVDDASAGDVSLFYYAGHGSQVQNTASEEADQLDESLVPADSYKGAYDIRDKEMVRLYRAALAKKVLLTVILDSCHSGGMSRGPWNAAGKTRVVPPDPRVSVSDPPDTDPLTGRRLPDPVKMGMLFLAAAREDQSAGETTVTIPDAKGVNQEIPHGAFTAALSKVLESSIANQSVEQICDRVQAIMASQGSMQVPICAGADRATLGLLGQPAGSANSILIPVESVTPQGSVRLRGGTALGLAPGCTLVRSDGQKIKLELTSVELGVSEAKILDSASTGRVHSGDLFKLETWVASENGAIKMFYAKDGPTADAILEVARTIKQFAEQKGFQEISDLTDKTKPTHVLYWKDAGYHLVCYPATGQPVSLGPAPSSAAIQSALAGASNIWLWPIFPPDRQLAASLNLGAGTQNAAIQIVDNSADSLYFLAGRLHGNTVEYSWVFKDIFLADPDKARLPLRSDWTSSAEQLTSLATRLGRVYAWLNLNGPTGGDHSFPYSLTFQKAGKPGAASTDVFKFGEQYKFIFSADQEVLRVAAATGGVSRRYVYVFLIDSLGNATCFFPDPENGNDGNLLPRTDPPTPTIEATRKPYDVEISAPAGTDNYFLISSEQPLDPSIFQWAGVRQRPTGMRGSNNPLDALFASVGEGTRGASKAPSVPATWSVQSMAVRSQP